MKINITIEPEDIGYINISPLNGQNPFKLEVDDNECTLIIVDVLDYIPHNQFVDTIRHYVTKLRKTGTIILSGTDIIEASKHIFNQRLDVVTANKILYGEQNHSWRFKKSCSSVSTIVNLVEGLGLKVIHKRLTEDGRFSVEARRD